MQSALLGDPPLTRADMFMRALSDNAFRNFLFKFAALCESHYIVISKPHNVRLKGLILCFKMSAQDQGKFHLSPFDRNKIWGDYYEFQKLDIRGRKIVSEGKLGEFGTLLHSAWGVFVISFLRRKEPQENKGYWFVYLSVSRLHKLLQSPYLQQLLQRTRISYFNFALECDSP